MTGREYRMSLSPALDEILNGIEIDSGLNKSEILRQALVLYHQAYETIKADGRVLLEVPQDGTYNVREVILGR
ncbi:MAG: hypothetical protein AABW53_01895 [Nanoarchaeota archaeon]